LVAPIFDEVRRHDAAELLLEGVGMSAHRRFRHHNVPAIARPVALVCLILLALGGAVSTAAPPAHAASDSGKLLWTRVWDRTAAFDSLDACCAGSGGTLYACGTTASDWTTQGDLLLVKYKPGGGRAWARAWNGDASQLDWGSAVAADHQGNVIVAGVVTSAGGDRDWVVAKWSAGGALRWATTYAGPGDSSNGLTTDLFAGGFSTGGARRWTDVYDNPKGGDDWTSALAADGKGAMYIAAVAGTAAPFSRTAQVVKWDAAGHVKWRRSYRGSSDAEYWAIAADEEGGIWCGGYAVDAVSQRDALVARYTAGGARRWLWRVDAGSLTDDAVLALALSGTGDLYAAGSSIVPPSDFAALVLRLRR
jgi:hypothetical protein